MHIERQVSLAPYHTFGIQVKAKELIRISSTSELDDLPDLPLPASGQLILGGGSNLLFTENYPGRIIKNEILGREIVKQTDKSVWIRFGAGENWHQVVLFAIENGWGGIENLSLIPGTVGAAPMQNIGAYGVELSSVFSCLEAMNMDTGKMHTFNAIDCDFGYRYSVFKGPLRHKYLITAVELKLSKDPKFNTSYGAVANTLESMGVKKLTLKAVSDAVIKIRTSKLPDPQQIGNAGSFFKNPSINQHTYDQLKNRHPDMPGYPVDGHQIKVPAGWLIESCGWKGKRRGPIGVHHLQALVLVNYGGGQGSAVYQLAQDVQSSVLEKFGIKLEPEVNII